MLVVGKGGPVGGVFMVPPRKRVEKFSGREHRISGCPQ